MDWFDKSVDKASQLWQRGFDRKVRVAVTGLSGAGKTALITSLINQLLHTASHNQLPFLEVTEEQRLKATRLTAHQELHIPAFPYEKNLNSITEPSRQWPSSTTNISLAQINCRYSVKNKWLKTFREDSVLRVEIIDYPGEWLLDLPLLQLSFKEWSRLCVSYLSSQRRQQYVKSVTETIHSLRFHLGLVEPELSATLSEVATEYRQCLTRYRQEHLDYSVALPGRFILPGELKGAPVLDFFPVLNHDILELDWDTFEEDSLLKQLENRYDYYQKKVIRPFFDEYFSNVDRQILLVDTNSVLEAGYEAYQELQKTIEQLLQGFSYGRSNWLKRLFAPSIDRLMIATTKVDLLPPDQHRAIEAFMQKMVAQAQNDVGYDGVEVKTMAISSVATTEPVTTEHEGQQLLCVKGEGIDGQPVIHYPGRIPDKRLSREMWEQLDIDITECAIPKLVSDEPLPHVRLDKVLQFLIGDKFR